MKFVLNVKEETNLQKIVHPFSLHPLILYKVYMRIGFAQSKKISAKVSP